MKSLLKFFTWSILQQLVLDSLLKLNLSDCCHTCAMVGLFLFLTYYFCYMDCSVTCLICMDSWIELIFTWGLLLQVDSEIFATTHNMFKKLKKNKEWKLSYILTACMCSVIEGLHVEPFWVWCLIWYFCVLLHPTWLVSQIHECCGLNLLWIQLIQVRLRHPHPTLLWLKRWDLSWREWVCFDKQMTPL